MDPDSADIDALVEGAEDDSVTRKSLTDSGQLSGLLFSTEYQSVISYLDPGEQPHYIVEPNYGGISLGGGNELADGKKQRHVFTDQRVLLVSTEYEISIPYDTITDLEERPDDHRLVVGIEDRAEPYKLISASPADLADFVRRQLVAEGAETLADRIANLGQMREENLVDEGELGRLLDAELTALVESSTPVSQRIEQLETVHERNLISDEEFERRKGQILGNL